MTKMQQETICNLHCVNTHTDNSIDITKKYNYTTPSNILYLGSDVLTFLAQLLIKHWPDTSDNLKRYFGTTILIQIHTVLA